LAVRGGVYLGRWTLNGKKSKKGKKGKKYWHQRFLRNTKQLKSSLKQANQSFTRFWRLSPSE